jgi:hypothetical protein
VKNRWVTIVAGLVVLAAADPSAHRVFFREAGAQAAADAPERSSVVIELFTSEGCSSCPPADGFLSKLETEQPIPGVEIIALEEHVDYWNHDGWEDPFSRQEWTERQQEYVARFKGDTPYTPQMILNGEKVMALKSGAEVEQTILQAAKEDRTEVSIVAVASDKLDAAKFEVHVGNLPGAQDKADVWMAVTEEGLHSDVKAGENKGKMLEHAAVVRTLEKIGSTPAKGATPFVANPQIKLKANWKRENLRVVVFVQDRKSWRIVGAASVKVS